MSNCPILMSLWTIGQLDNFKLHRKNTLKITYFGQKMKIYTHFLRKNSKKWQFIVQKLHSKNSKIPTAWLISKMLLSKHPCVVGLYRYILVFGASIAFSVYPWRLSFLKNMMFK